jgi:hypothetical protein
VDRVLGTIPSDRQVTLVETELEIHAIRNPAESASFREADARFRAKLAEFIERGMELLGRRLTLAPLDLADAAIAVAERSARLAFLEGGASDPDAMARKVLPTLLLSASSPSTEPA